MKKAFFLLQAFFMFLVTMHVPTALAAPVAGKDYVALNPAQPVDTGDKIEVLEAFSYGCPHCYQFEPPLSAWIKTLPPDVVVRKLPISFSRENWANLAKVYYTLETTGELGKHVKVFDAIHSQKIDLSKPDVLFDWVAKQGLDRKKFEDTYNSFSIQTKSARLPQLTRNYGIESVPSLIIDGKYRIITQGQYEDVFRVANELIALARSQRPAKAAATAAPPATAATPAADPKKKAVTK